MHGHVVDEALGALAVLLQRRQHRRTGPVEGADAVDLQRHRVRLIGETAEDHGRAGCSD
jgi:hypothetical protein